MKKRMIGSFLNSFLSKQKPFCSLVHILLKLWEQCLCLIITSKRHTSKNVLTEDVCMYFYIIGHYTNLVTFLLVGNWCQYGILGF